MHAAKKKRPLAAFPFLAVLLLAAAGLRLWCWAQASGEYMRSHDPEEGYYEQGVGVLSRGVFALSPSTPAPANWRGPMFPSFLALTEAAFPTPSPAHPRLFQTVLSLLAVAFVFWLGGKAFGPWAGLAGAALLAFDPGQILSAGSLNVHAFYGILLLVLAGASALWAEKPTRAHGALLGAAFAASLLTRSAHVLCVPLVLALGAFRGDGLRAALKRAAPPVLILLAGLAPWTLRNAAQFRVFEPLDTASGAVNLYTASLGKVESASVDEAVGWAAAEDPAVRTLFERSGGRVFPRLRRLAEAHILRSPVRYLVSCAARWRRLFDGWGLLWAAALFAVWSRRTRASGAVFLVAASMSGYALIAVQGAYADAARPLFALLAGAALSEAARRLGRPRPPAASALDQRLARNGAAALAGAVALVFAASAVFAAREVALFPPGAAVDQAPAPRDRRAELVLTSIAVRDPSGPNWLTVGRYFGSLRRTAESCAAFRDAERFPETRAEALRRAAECSLTLGKPGDADAALTRLLEEKSLSPGDAAELLAARAGTRLSLRRPREAAADLSRALSADAGRACRPDDRLVDPSAMPPAYFQACLKRFPDDAALWTNLGVSLWKAERRAEARAAFRSALKRDPGALGAALSLAYSLDDKAEARRVLREALSVTKEPADSSLRAEAAQEAASKR